MKSRHMFGFLVAVLAILLAAPAVSAFADINDVVVNGVEFDDFGSDPTTGVFAGETIAVRVTFTATAPEEEARVIARIRGEPGLSEATERFDVLQDSTYSRLLHIDLPSHLDDETEDTFELEVTVESNAGEGDVQSITLKVQRVNNLLEILAIESGDEVKAGESFPLDVVIKNRGRDKARDVFVRASIPELGISKMVYLNDIYEIDHQNEDEEDAALGRLFLSIPRDAPAGLYNVEIEAFNNDATVVATRKVVVVGGGVDSSVITSQTSKTFASGEDQTYTVTVVNADNTIKVYELILEAANGLSVMLDESLIAVPAGSSKTVRLTANAVQEGTYNFAVNVHSDGELVSKQSFVASVEGESNTTTGNAAVVLTIILAIIFVVLLIVLIVLLTRKPEKQEDFGESYY